MATETKPQPIEKLGALDFSGRSRCQRPCYISRLTVEEGKGGQHNPFHWVINVGGYPIVNIVIQFRGKVGKYFQVQVRHHHPSASVGPTATFVFASESGNLGPAGFEMATFNGLRPMLPEVDIVAFSDDEEDFDVVAATIYATVA
jgi:hypothetical protein